MGSVGARTRRNPRRGKGSQSTAESLRILYHGLFNAFGPQGWWPAKGPFEVMVGAILTQATNWHNVEQAITRLKAARGLHPRRLLAMPRRHLEEAIRPTGYFRQKAERLQRFSQWFVARYGGSAHRMFRTPWQVLREEFLALHGIGPETADSILLYAGGQPVFVIDAYTTRILRRHRLIGRRSRYEDVQQLMMRAVPKQASLYNEFHALLVAVGKRFCHRTQPDCEHCPLGHLPHTSR